MPPSADIATDTQLTFERAIEVRALETVTRFTIRVASVLRETESVAIFGPDGEPCSSFTFEHDGTFAKALDVPNRGPDGRFDGSFTRNTALQTTFVAWTTQVQFPHDFPICIRVTLPSDTSEEGEHRLLGWFGPGQEISKHTPGLDPALAADERLRGWYPCIGRDLKPEPFRRGE
jgi:hypothetical protein